MNNALVSAIIPVYNVSEYIERCVESLVSQTYNNIEIILINDGSTDNSGEVCRNLKGLYGDKIVYIEQENQGVSAARNAGLKAAKGEYIVFVDADDWVSSNYVDKLYTALSDSSADLASCGFIEWYSEAKKFKHIRPDPGLYSKEEFYRTMRLRQVPLWTTMYKTSLIKENAIEFDTLLRRMEDGCFVADYTSYCDKFVVIPEYLYFYFQREGSVMHVTHTSSLLGVERSAYIYEKMEKAYSRSLVNKEYYESEFHERWSGFIPRVAVGITRKDNELTRKEKREFIVEAIKVSNIKRRLASRDISKSSFLNKLMIRWTVHERVGFILLYGKMFNLLKGIKRKIKGAK